MYGRRLWACGDRYKDSEVPALGHSYVDGVCTRCGAHKACEGGENCPSGKFTDVPGTKDWAHSGIDYCIEKTLMNGTSDTVFSPNGTLTRAQLVTILYRIAGKLTVITKDTFTNVASGVWYSDVIEWSAENKIVNGVGKGKYDPDGKITREQIATILYRFEGEPKVSGNQRFPDAASVSVYAGNAMLWATNGGLITGISSDGIAKLQPKNNATRAQIAAIIMRYLESK